MVLFPALAWGTAALNLGVTGADGEHVHESAVTWVLVVAFQVPKSAPAAEVVEGAVGQYDHDRVPRPSVSRSGSRVPPYWVNAELLAATS